MKHSVPACFQRPLKEELFYCYFNHALLSVQFSTGVHHVTMLRKTGATVKNNICYIWKGGS